MRASIRLPILFLIIATLVIAAAVGVYTSQAGDLGQTAQTDLTNHKENQDRAPAEPACTRGQYGEIIDAPGPHTDCEEKPPADRGQGDENGQGQGLGLGG
jgi:hypothetical protein